MRKMVVHLCKGCQETYKEEFGDDMGYTVPVKVITVPKKKCDNWERPDGTLNQEHKTFEYVEED